MKTWILTLVFCTVTAASVFAEPVMLSGEVISIEKNGQIVTFAPGPGADRGEVHLSMDSVKNVLGIEKVGDLEPGDQIAVQVLNDNTDVLEVETVEVLVEKQGEDKSALVRESREVHVKPKEYAVSAQVETATEDNNPKYEFQEREQTVRAKVNVPGHSYSSQTVSRVPVEDGKADGREQTQVQVEGKSVPAMKS